MRARIPGHINRLGAPDALLNLSEDAMKRKKGVPSDDSFNVIPDDEADEFGNGEEGEDLLDDEEDIDDEDLEDDEDDEFEDDFEDDAADGDTEDDFDDFADGDDDAE